MFLLGICQKGRQADEKEKKREGKREGGGERKPHT